MSEPFRPIFSSRLNGVSESATLKLNSLVTQMRSQGIDVVNFTTGEPDFAVPEAGKIAAKAAIDANRSKYTPTAGIPELRESVALKTNRQQPSVAAVRPWKAAEVIITNGGKQALFNAFFALLNSGDEVIIPSPFWLSYPEMVKLAGGVPCFIETTTASGFKMTPDQLRAQLTERTKILVINSPSNPTGAMYSCKELAALGDVFLHHPLGKQVWILSDEIYDRVVFNDSGMLPFTSFLEAAPGLRDRVITINGMSKSGSMTGWRVGWSVANAEVTQAMNILQGQSTSGINSVAQWASVATLALDEAEFASQIERYRARRDLCVQLLRVVPNLEIFVPQGAFYLWIGVKQFLKPGEDSMGFCERALNEARVALVPGAPFGAPASVRMSFANDEKALSEGCSRIVKFLT